MADVPLLAKLALIRLRPVSRQSRGASRVRFALVGSLPQANSLDKERPPPKELLLGDLGQPTPPWFAPTTGLRRRVGIGSSSGTLPDGRSIAEAGRKCVVPTNSADLANSDVFGRLHGERHYAPPVSGVNFHEL